MTNPLNYEITSPYGIRRKYTIQGRVYEDTHDGVDFAMPQGTPVTLPPGGDWDGRVIYAGLDQFGGAFVDVKADSDGYISRYLHLSRIDVEKGQKVKSNQQIGLSGGALGTWGSGTSTGAHLHLGLLTPEYRSTDPLPWLQKAYANQTIIDPNKLTMEEKQLLEGYAKAIQEAIETPEFNKLQDDEKFALAGGSIPNIKYFVARIVGLRNEKAAESQKKSEELVSLQKQLQNPQSEPVESQKTIAKLDEKGPEPVKFDTDKFLVGFAKLNVDKATYAASITVVLTQFNDILQLGVSNGQITAAGGLIAVVLIVAGSIRQSFKK